MRNVLNEASDDDRPSIFDEPEGEPESQTLTCCAKISALTESPWIFWLRHIVNFNYSFFVSLLFAAFSYRRVNNINEKNVPLGLFYAGCSFIMNAPMAWLFTEKLITLVKKIFEKKEKAFIVAAVVGLFLATGTTAAAFQVAVHAVSSLEFITNVGLRIVLTGLFVFNTFSTRIIGSAYLLFSLWQIIQECYQKLWGERTLYYQLRDDINRYGQQVEPVNVRFSRGKQQPSEAALLKDYTRAFYSALSKANLRPGNNCWGTFKNVLIYVPSLLLVGLMINVVPLWAYLGENGVGKLSKFLAQSTVFITYAAASNELFYLNSAAKFFFIFHTFRVSAWDTTVKKFSGYDENKVKMGFCASGFVFLVVCTALAYFSGEGYGKEASAVVKDGYMSGWTSLFPQYDQLVTVAAGIIVNGGSFLDFCSSSIIPLFQSQKKASENTFGSPDALRVLDAAIDGNDFKPLDDKNVSDVIEVQRNKANPHSLWSCGYENDEERQELNGVHPSYG